RPTAPTTFPYTTLFRSGQRERGHSTLVGCRSQSSSRRVTEVTARRYPLRLLTPTAFAPLQSSSQLSHLSILHLHNLSQRCHPGEDRKSTRLNSSHEWIS